MASSTKGDAICLLKHLFNYLKQLDGEDEA